MAEVQPPPVIVYPPTSEQAHNGAGHYSKEVSGARPIQPPPQPPVEPRYPPVYDPRFPDTRHTGHTDGRVATHTETRYPVTPARRPNPPVAQPALHVDSSASGVSRVKPLETNITMRINDFYFRVCLVLVTTGHLLVLWKRGKINYWIKVTKLKNLNLIVI